VAVALRTTLLLPLDDLLAVVREFLNPSVSRSGRLPTSRERPLRPHLGHQPSKTRCGCHERLLFFLRCSRGLLTLDLLHLRASGTWHFRFGLIPLKKPQLATTLEIRRLFQRNQPRADALLKGVIHGRQFLGSGGTHFARCSPPRP